MRQALPLLLVAALGPRAHALAEGVRGVRPGEAFTFTFSVGPVQGGRARMSIGLPQELHGRQLIAAHGQAETSSWLKSLVPLDDDYKLVFDATTLLPVEVVSDEHGLRERRIATQLDGRRAILDVKAKRNGGHGIRILPAVVRDPLSALFALRAAPLVDGARLQETVLDGLALWRARLSVHRGAEVRLTHDGKAAPPRRAIRIDVELTPIDVRGRNTGRPRRHLTVWLSDDPIRVLLRLNAETDLGPASLELSSYLPPR